MSDVEKKTGKDTLKCILTNQEKLTLGQDLAMQVSKLEDEEAALKDVSAQYKAKIQSAKAAISLSQKVLNAGYEMRPVEIEILYDFVNGSVHKLRIDTGEIYDTRAMTADEREMTFSNMH